MSIVSVSTNPPIVNHGSGPTLESARAAASLEAINMLKELDVLKYLNSGMLNL